MVSQISIAILHMDSQTILGFALKGISHILDKP